MSNLFWIADEQMARLRPFFPKSHGKLRVDDQRVLSGTIFINCNILRCSDAPGEYCPSENLQNRWKRWSDQGVFARIMEGLAAGHSDHNAIMIDANYLKAHRTASSLRLKRGRERLIGRTKGAMNTRLHAMADASGRPIRFFMIAGQVSDCTGARTLMSSLPAADWMIAATM
ncbi:putative transposase of IS4/5 family DUF4096 [Aliiruegeria haliotis]|uniref:Putative transposase of IS4/5 family DUF4096 n=1 Tax=Aliiruegeria haliotis TaxID=1280846 RepID=A0A2T0RPY8_9RHOB|nr:putative transposase of IS4/5 family DUF4096 [Aliiruegeria haliotis]